MNFNSFCWTTPVFILILVAPLTYFNEWGGGGGVWVIFWGLKFWAKVVFLGLKDAEIGVTKKKRDFLGCERDFFGYAEKSSDFLG